MKPTLDSLEAVAIQNQLDIEMVLASCDGLLRTKERRERIENLSARYREVTGEEYIYDDKRWRRE